MKSSINVLVAGVGLFILGSHLHAQSFVLASSPSVGSGPRSVMAADVNGDGKTDLITVNISDNTLTVLTNNGGGGFALAHTFAVSNCSFAPYVDSSLTAVTTADVNRDGKVDLICANYGGNTLIVLTNNGNGNFGSNATYAVGSQPISVTAADVNGDGKVDLICVNYGDDTLSVLTNNGGGKFTLASTPNVGVGPGPWAVTAADVNGDGKVDLICVNNGVNTLTVLTNKGNGQFGFNATYTVGYQPISVAAVDVNGDGNIDLICANSGEGTVTVLTNNGSGGFAPAYTNAVGGFVSDFITAVTAADLNGDGKVDLICADGNFSALTVLTNNGSGNFGSNATYAVGNYPFSSPYSKAIAVADVNGDGKPDLICANYGGNTLTVLFQNTFLPRAATATAVLINGFVVTATITDAGYGYTTAPVVTIVGGGGSGAQATAMVSNGIVTAIIILNAGSGYNIVISPPPVAPLSLGIAPAALLGFTNLAVGSNYQLQVSQSGTWANLGSSFVSAASSYSQYVDGSGNGSLYRLAVLPILPGATATPILAYGFVVAATVTSGSSRYVSVPAVHIVGGGGSGAQATATISNGIVTAIIILNAGSGYTDTPTIQIDPPPVSALLPGITKAFRLDYSGLNTITLAYQLQASPNLTGWTNFGAAFAATANTNSQYLNFGTGSQFFRLSKP